MTVDEMPAGRELDALVAEKVMRLGVRNGDTLETQQRGIIAIWEDGVVRTLMRDDISYVSLHNYSTDITAAWLVVKKLKADGIHLWKLGEEDSAPGWTASMGLNLKPGVHAWAETAPLAICRAAFKAVETALLTH